MNVQEMIDRSRAALEKIMDYNQEDVDKLVFAAARVIYENAKPLAKEAVEETRLGCVEDKVGKNTDTPTEFWNYLKDKRSVGIIEDDKETGVIKIAHPVGVIGCITPATNPTITPMGNFMHAIKGKNAVIVCPAPRAVKTSTHTVNLIREALKEAGAPEDLIQIIEEPTLAKSQELMALCDLVLATGASSLTKAAYSSGTPAYGVGPGNPPVVLDDDYDLDTAAEQTITAVGSDNGILCDGDNLLLHPEKTADKFYETLKKHGVVIFDKPEDVAKFREVLFLPNGKSNPDLVGCDADVIAKAAGFDIPEKTKIIALVSPVVGKEDILCHEIMGPIVILKTYDKFEEAVSMAIQNMEESGGIGHTAGIFSNNEEHIKYYAEKIPVARVLINQPTPDAWGPSTNALSPAVSEGCGSWGNNILAGNVDYIHLINVSQAVRKLDVELPDGAKLFNVKQKDF